MKVKKRLTIIADMMVDEGFDTNFLLIAQDISDQINVNSPLILVPVSDVFEVVDYIYQGEIEIK